MTAAVVVSIWVIFVVEAWLAVRVREDRRAVERIRDNLKAPLLDGDAYRTPQLPQLNPRPRVYCQDCRFIGTSATGKSICLALPEGGEFLYVGAPKTNLNHDCEHFELKLR